MSMSDMFFLFEYNRSSAFNIPKEIRSVSLKLKSSELQSFI